ncbi:carbohydrate sulfotransferase 14-like [Dermatophagoides farinae]|uniref:carbohydrate sulfotransferase 14-like n=1 Tax=Dermatophagoides farinae TaxID=6954 RepID=UPI003F5EF9DB
MNSVNNRRQTDDSVELSTLNHGSNNHSAMISNGNNRSDFQIISSQLHPHHNYHDSQLPQVFIIQQQQQQQQHQQSEQRQQQNSSYDQRLKFGLNFRTIIILIVAIIIASIAIRSLYKSFRCDPNHYRYRYSGSNGHPVHSVFRIAENRRYVIEDGVRKNSEKYSGPNDNQQQSSSSSPWWNIGSWCPPPNDRQELVANPFELAAVSLTLKNLTEKNIIKLLNSTSGSNDRDCQAQLGSSLERMQQVCKQYRLNNHLLSPWHSTTPESCKTTRLCPLMIDNSTKIMACFLPRVFEPEWFQKSFAYQYDHPQLMSMIQQAQLVNNTSYIRIMFVRHPFVRLVDAFKKRFELAEFLPDGRPLIINNETMHVWTFEEWCEELLLPIDPYQYDPLWAPIWTQCEPCYVRYDLVGHYETFYQDFQNARQLFTNHSDISDNKNVDIPIVNDRDCDKRSYQETQQYIRRLKPKTIMALYAKYYLDFELFGYTIDEIF